MMASIPVNVFNPGQVLACQGFLEAADILLGGAKGWFEEGRFHLEALGETNPFRKVLEFLAAAEVQEQNADVEGVYPGPDTTNAKTTPIRFVSDSKVIDVSHWADESGRNKFKLYAGAQSGKGAAGKMLKGFKTLYKNHENLAQKPFDVLTAVKGSFHFDAREAWDALSAGYSPNDAKHTLTSSPVVEILAAIGLEYARPDEYEKSNVRYGIWGTALPPVLARTILGGSKIIGAVRYFRFELFMPGDGIKNLTFAQEEVGL